MLRRQAAAAVRLHRTAPHRTGRSRGCAPGGDMHACVWPCGHVAMQMHVAPGTLRVLVLPEATAADAYGTGAVRCEPCCRAGLYTVRRL